MRAARFATIAVALLNMTAVPVAAQEAEVSATPAPSQVLTLDECVAIAIEHHPSLKAGAASVDAAQQRVYQAASGYLPQVRGVYEADRRHTSTAARTGASSSSGTRPQTFNFFNTGVSFTQVLFDFGQTLDRIQAAQASEQSVQADLAQQRDTVVFNVKQAYFGWLATKRLVTVADDAVRQSRQHLGLAEARHDVGFAPRFDVTREQVQLASNELSLLSAQNNFAVARETMRNAMGLEGAIDFDIADDPQVDILDVDENAALNRAYANRPEILRLQAQERALEEQTAALRKDYLPSLTSDGYYQWSGTRYPLQSNWNIGANVTIDLFNGGLTRAQVGELQANLANLQHNETLVRQNVALEVRQTILNLRQAGKSIGVSATGLRQARENLELAEGRYQTGVGNVIEITDAQAALTTAEAQYVQAAYNYRNSLAALERAVAQSLDSGDPITRKVAAR